ncbi:Uncharacterised protein [Candidatus Burarchaeum australiense]|nr:Uncharacterised protein [Candidatus Burarchaeum australiense]
MDVAGIGTMRQTNYRNKADLRTEPGLPSRRKFMNRALPEAEVRGGAGASKDLTIAAKFGKTETENLTFVRSTALGDEYEYVGSVNVEGKLTIAVDGQVTICGDVKAGEIVASAGSGNHEDGLITITGALDAKKVWLPRSLTVLGPVNVESLIEAFAWVRAPTITAGEIRTDRLYIGSKATVKTRLTAGYIGFLNPDSATPVSISCEGEIDSWIRIDLTRVAGNEIKAQAIITPELNVVETVKAEKLIDAKKIYVNGHIEAGEEIRAKEFNVDGTYKAPKVNIG